MAGGRLPGVHRLCLQHRPYQLRQVQLCHQSGKGWASGSEGGLQGSKAALSSRMVCLGHLALNPIAPHSNTTGDGVARQFPSVLEIAVGVIRFGRKDICFSLLQWKRYSVLETGSFYMLLFGLEGQREQGVLTSFPATPWISLKSITQLKQTISLRTQQCTC